MNVLTVGDLCSLTEQEVHHLPIAQPKVLNVRRAMNKFAARNRLNIGSIIQCRFYCTLFLLSILAVDFVWAPAGVCCVCQYEYLVLNWSNIGIHSVIFV